MISTPFTYSSEGLMSNRRFIEQGRETYDHNNNHGSERNETGGNIPKNKQTGIRQSGSVFPACPVLRRHLGLEYGSDGRQHEGSHCFRARCRDRGAHRRRAHVHGRRGVYEYHEPLQVDTQNACGGDVRVFLGESEIYSRSGPGDALAVLMQPEIS